MKRNGDLWGNLQKDKCWKAYWILEVDTLTGEWDLVKYMHVYWAFLFHLMVTAKMGRDICAWRRGLMVVVEKDFFFFLNLLQWWCTAKYPTLLPFYCYFFFCIIRCWDSWTSKEGNTFHLQCSKMLSKKKVGPNIQISAYLCLPCLPSNDCTSVFIFCKSRTKSVVFVFHSCLFCFPLSSKSASLENTFSPAPCLPPSSPLPLFSFPPLPLAMDCCQFFPDP